MVFIVDNSVTMSWCFTDEATESVLNLLRDSSAVVPAIWPLEDPTSCCWGREDGGSRIPGQHALYGSWQELPISIDGEAVSKALDPVMQLGREYGLTSYDAAYLELAMRRGLPLATLDERLVTAATQAGVALVG